jgi:hypothetical protein
MDARTAPTLCRFKLRFFDWSPHPPCILHRNYAGTRSVVDSGWYSTMYPSTALAATVKGEAGLEAIGPIIMTADAKMGAFGYHRMLADFYGRRIEVATD